MADWVTPSFTAALEMLPDSTTVANACRSCSRMRRPMRVSQLDVFAIAVPNAGSSKFHLLLMTPSRQFQCRSAHPGAMNANDVECHDEPDVVFLGRNACITGG